MNRSLGEYLTAVDVAAALESRLSAEAGLKYERIEPGKISKLIGSGMHATWSMRLKPDYLGITRTLYLALPEKVAVDPPIAAVVPVAYQEWPHAERSGRLCLWERNAPINRTSCSGLVGDFFEQVGGVLHFAQETTDPEERRAEFEREWLSYWLPRNETRAPSRAYLITRPPSAVTGLFAQTLIRAGTSRDLPKGHFRTSGGYWRPITLFSSSLDELKRWGNDFRPVSALPDVETALYIPVRNVVTPGMPRSLPELCAWVSACAGSAATEELVETLESLEGDGRRLPVVFGLQTAQGYALNGATIKSKLKSIGPRGRFRRKLLRQGSKRVDAEPNWSVQATMVDQADPGWMQDRNVDGDVRPLRSKHVVVIGCGMLGAPIVETLARAGVGKLTLIDPDVFEPANVGRHVLGASYIGQRKVDGIAHHVRASIPSVEVVPLSRDVADQMDPCPFDSTVDLVICCTADARSEHYLMELRRTTSGFPRKLLICWLEPYAVAGHALLSLDPADDLQGLFDPKGEFLQPCIDWPSGLPVHRMAACQATFQPAGMSAAMGAIAMCGTIALDALQDPGQSGRHGFWFADGDRVRRFKGTPAPWTFNLTPRAHLEQPTLRP